jgi:hypothetical protein
MDGPEKPKPLAQAIVRRREGATPAPITAPFTSELYPPQEHVGRSFRVHSEIVWPAVTERGELRGPPQLRLQWRHHPGKDGTQIVGFRRAAGFGIDGDHGERIVNSRFDGKKVEALDAGDYFYTFCTCSSFFGAVRVHGDEVQFSVAVPSVERVLQLMRQAIEFRKLEQEYQKLVEPASPPQEPEPTETPAARFEREFAAATSTLGARTQAGDWLDREWAERKREIKAGPYGEAERKRMLRRLGRVMRDLREQFEL